MGRGGIKISFMLLKYINEKTNLLSDKKNTIYFIIITPHLAAIMSLNFIISLVHLYNAKSIYLWCPRFSSCKIG